MKPGRECYFLVSSRRGIIAAVLVTALGACTGNGVGPVTTQGVTLLRHDLAPEDIPSPGVGDGELVVFNGCVALGLSPDETDPVSFAEAATYLVWPAGYELREGGSGWEVVDADGDPVGHVGDRVRLDSHAYGLGYAEEHAQIPEACRATGTTGGVVTDKWFFVR